MSSSSWYTPREDDFSQQPLPSDISMKDATPLLTFDDSFDSSTVDPDQLLFGPLDMEEGNLFSHPTSSQWDTCDLSYPPMSPPTFAGDASSSMYSNSLSTYSPHGVSDSPYSGYDDFKGHSTT
ncbi:hypothetical protein CONPUDRAFT_153167 [Coniophora puteana RWD-64-598 SS2]|uniref:Uncharacterized protein n=1 Tax=Coniophora puteana (strain RWD-64-598) TaxID=741705 RepID=A0A5M3MSY8_CONPW|nr:uncharacterized protein CONPUDRAFT_153167 [Coniophora puteana RWD-64-598 SS2]EIW82282.1 hypothetical protein CONPUDRAFT_153167 [Coniophora puteana RWD-64-598 SS2]